MKRPQGIVILILLAFTLFMGGAQASIVLCIEANGRITLEDSSDRCCLPFGSASSLGSSNSSTVVPLPTESSCGSCVDIPLPLGGIQTPLDRVERKAPSITAPLDYAPDTAFSVIPSGATIPTFKPPQEPPLIHLRTIVLRF